MATMEEQLQALLKLIAPTYPNSAPDNATGSYIVYFNVNNAPKPTLANGLGINNTRMQIDVYADTYATAHTLAASIAAAMEGWALQNIPKSSGDRYEAPVRKHRVTLDYSIWWN